MEIEGTPEELAALALAIQERPVNTINVADVKAERQEFADWLEEELARRLKSRMTNPQT